MADAPHDHNSNGDNRVRAGRETTDEGMPRWVKVFGIIGIVLILLFVILHLTGHAPSHGP
jgi:hypothetical protein